MESKIHIWLDDERDPRDPLIKQKFGSIGDEIWVKTAADAIGMLADGLIDSISFDHDLGEVSPGTSGYDVAKWIESAAYHNTIDRVIWRVHSANPVGRKNIMAAMDRADYYWSGAAGH